MNVTTQPTRAPIAMPVDGDPIESMTALEVLGALRDEAAVTHQDPDGVRIDGDDAVRTLRMRGWDLRASSVVRAAMDRLGLFRTTLRMLEVLFVWASTDSRDDVRAALGVMLTALRRFLTGKLDQAALVDAATDLERLLWRENDTAAAAFRLIAGGVDVASDFTLPYRTHLALIVVERDLGLEGVAAVVQDMEAHFNADTEHTATGVLPAIPELTTTALRAINTDPATVDEFVESIGARLRDRGDRSPLGALVDVAVADAKTPEQANEIRARIAEVACEAILNSHGMLGGDGPAMPILDVATALAEAADLGYEPQDLEMSAEIGSIDLVASLIVTDAIERGVTLPEIKATMLGAMVDTLRPMIDAMPAAVRLLAYVEAGHDELS